VYTYISIHEYVHICKYICIYLYVYTNPGGIRNGGYGVREVHSVSGGAPYAVNYDV
jgi:hypothetical protein